MDARELEALILRHELGLLHEAQTRETLEARLAREFEEVGPGGRVSGREDVLRWLLEIKKPEERWELRDFRLTRLSSGLALARYHARRHGSASPGALHSSLWRRDDGEWRMVFHQATPLAAER